MEIDKHDSIYEFGCKSFHLLLASSRNAIRREKFIEGHFREDVTSLRLRTNEVRHWICPLTNWLKKYWTAIVCLFRSVCI